MSLKIFEHLILAFIVLLHTFVWQKQKHKLSDIWVNDTYIVSTIKKRKIIFKKNLNLIAVMLCNNKKSKNIFLTP